MEERLEIPGSVWNVWEYVGASGTVLGASGRVWEYLVASGSVLGASENAGTTSECLVACESLWDTWQRVGASGNVWGRLAGSGSLRECLATSGKIWERAKASRRWLWDRLGKCFISKNKRTTFHA